MDRQEDCSKIAALYMIGRHHQIQFAEVLEQFTVNIAF